MACLQNRLTGPGLGFYHTQRRWLYLAVRNATTEIVFCGPYSYEYGGPQRAYLHHISLEEAGHSKRSFCSQHALTVCSVLLAMINSCVPRGRWQCCSGNTGTNQPIKPLTTCCISQLILQCSAAEPHWRPDCARVGHAGKPRQQVRASNLEARIQRAQ